MKKTLKSIQFIAKDTRKWAKNVADDYGSNDDLFCMCAITSFEIFSILAQNGFNPEFVHNNSHCFVEVNGYVVDITARQFSHRFPNIIACKRNKLPKSKLGHSSIWESRFRCTTPKEIKKSLKDWPYEQLPIPLRKKVSK